MKTKSSIALFSVLVLAAAMLGCSSSASTPNREKAKSVASTVAAPSSRSRTLENPCYVHIWEDENFEDNNDIIFGPGRWSNMRHLPGANKDDWGDEIDSLKVGPTATVTVWEDENFGDNSQTYGPGTEKTNLRGNPDMGDQIDSMEIKCQ